MALSWFVNFQIIGTLATAAFDSPKVQAEVCFNSSFCSFGFSCSNQHSATLVWVWSSIVLKSCPSMLADGHGQAENFKYNYIYKYIFFPQRGFQSLYLVLMKLTSDHFGFCLVMLWKWRWSIMIDSWGLLLIVRNATQHRGGHLLMCYALETQTSLYSCNRYWNTFINLRKKTQWLSRTGNTLVMFPRISIICLSLTYS